MGFHFNLREGISQPMGELETFLASLNFFPWWLGNREVSTQIENYNSQYRSRIWLLP